MSGRLRLYFACAFLLPALLSAQVVSGGGDGSGGTISCSGTATTGYVATATSGGTNPPCAWSAVGSASVTNAAVTNALYFSDTSVTANTITGAPATAYPAYVVGSSFMVKVANTNTGATTINVNSLGAKSLVFPNGNAIGAGAVQSTGSYLVLYDGTNFILSSPQGYGSVNNVARWTAAGVLGTGIAIDTGTAFGLGTSPDTLLTMSSASGSGTILHVANTAAAGFGAVRFTDDSGTNKFQIALNGSSAGADVTLDYHVPLQFNANGSDTIIENNGGTADLFRFIGSGGMRWLAVPALGSAGVGVGSIWFDSTDLTFHAKNSGGTISTMIFPNACTGQVVGSINSNGTITCVAGGSGSVPTTRTITTTLPLTGGGDLSANRTFGINVFTGDSGSGGLAGSVPAPASGDAAAGKFLSAGGGWSVPAGGSGGAGNVPTGTVSSTNIILFSTCTTAGSPCNLSEGQGVIQQVSTTNTVPVPGSGSDTIYIYWTSSGCVIGSPSGVDILTTGSGPCAGHSTQGITDFPGDATAIVLSADYNAGAWAAPKNLAPVVSNAPNLVSSIGISIARDGQNATFSIDTSVASIGVGTQNHLSKWDSTGYTLVNSLVQDNGSGVGVNCAVQGSDVLSVCKNQNTPTLMGIWNTDTGSSALAAIQFHTDAGAASFGLDSIAGSSLFFFDAPADLWLSAHAAVRLVPNEVNTVTAPTDGGLQLVTGTRPTCDAGHRGTTFYVAGGTGVQDTYSVCAKDGADAYAWRTIY